MNNDYYTCIDDIRTSLKLKRPEDQLILEAAFPSPVRVDDLNVKNFSVCLDLAPAAFVSFIASRQQIMDLHEFFMRLEEELSRREKG